MGCLGWGSAYFYGWGTSFYYGFPWWVVGAGVDDVARSLFYAVTVIVIFLIGWGAGIVFFLAIKQKQYAGFEFYQIFLAILLLLVPPALEFSVIHRHITLGALTLCVITALIITLLASSGGRLVSVKCISEVSFIRRHRIECMMAGFMIYFWTFSLIAGWYKPQFKKEYQTLHYENARYYVLARYDDRLVLSQSYRNGSTKFVIINSGHIGDFEINVVRVR